MRYPRATSTRIRNRTPPTPPSVFPRLESDGLAAFPLGAGPRLELLGTLALSGGNASAGGSGGSSMSYASVIVDPLAGIVIRLPHCLHRAVLPADSSPVSNFLPHCSHWNEMLMFTSRQWAGSLRNDLKTAGGCPPLRSRFETIPSSWGECSPWSSRCL